MATKDDIPTDLAIEIGTNLSPKKFVAAARHFFDLVEAVAGSVPSASKTDWRVLAREGSTVLAMQPLDAGNQSWHSSVYDKFEAVTRHLVSGDIESLSMDEKALDHAKALSDLSKSDGQIVPIRFWIRREPILFGPDVADYIREDRLGNYSDYGTLEGHLNAIQDARGALEFKIKDTLYPSPIKCLVGEDHLEEVLGNFRNRVEVAGTIQFRRDGTPLSIAVDRVERLPDDSELPDADDVRGILAVGIG